MSFVLLISVRVAICVTILLYASLLAECTLLSRVFTRSLSMYHKQSLIYITKVISISAVVLFYDLLLVIPDEISLSKAIRMLSVQVIFTLIGFSFLKQSKERTTFVSFMKNKLANLRILETQTTQNKPVNMPAFVRRIQ